MEIAETFDVNRWPTILCAIVLGTVGVLSFIIQPGMVQGFVSTLRMSEPQAVNLAGFEVLGMAMATVILALVARRVDWRSIVAIGLLFAVLGNIGSALALGTPEFGYARFLAGLGEGTIISISFTFVGLTRKAERNIALYLVLLLTYGAFALWYLPSFLAAFGFSTLFVGFAILSALAAATIAFVPRSYVADVMENPEARQLPGTYLGVALGGVLAYNLAQGIAWGILFLVGVAAGHGEQRVADALFLSQIAAIGGALTSVFLASRLQRNHAIAIGILAGAVSIGLMVGRPGYALFTLAVCGFNFLWNFVLPFILGKVCDFDERGRMMAPAIAMQMVGLGGGPLIAAQLIGDGRYAPVEIVCIGLFLASYALLLLPTMRHARLLKLHPGSDALSS